MSSSLKDNRPSRGTVGDFLREYFCKAATGLHSGDRTLALDGQPKHLSHR